MSKNTTKKHKNPAAVEMGRRRWAGKTAEERRAHAKMMAEIMWKKRKKAKEQAAP
jgi:hypothetical protein